MTRRLLSCLVIVAALAPACGRKASSAGGGSSAAPADATMHGDHNPRHGGLVFMERDIHFELVAINAGQYQVWFTDMMRNALPASLVKDATITVLPSKGEPEVVPLHPDPTGTCWVGAGKAVSDKDATIRTSYVYKDKPYWIDVSYGLASNPPKSVPVTN